MRALSKRSWLKQGSIRNFGVQIVGKTFHEPRNTSGSAQAMIPSDRDQEKENHLRLYQILVLHICIRIFKSTAPYLGFVRRCPALRLVRSLKNKFRKACKATTTANSMHSWRRTQCVKLCGTYRTPIFSGGINKPLAFFLWSYVKAKSFSNEIKKM